MAMEYIYLDRTTKAPIELEKFNGLRYFYEEDCRDAGTLEILDAQGEQKAFFYVKPRTCYLLQRRNQSALQLHEVTPPRVFRDRVPWLFGFSRKQRCESERELDQVCHEYQVAHPGVKVQVKHTEYASSRLTYAFALGALGRFTVPVAYCCKWADGETWAFFGDYTICDFIVDLRQDFNFRYPLQYVIHQVRAMASLNPATAQDFFQERLRCYNYYLYYTDVSSDEF